MGVVRVCGAQTLHTYRAGRSPPPPPHPPQALHLAYIAKASLPPPLNPDPFSPPPRRSILSDEPTFKGRAWEGVSPEAQDFCKWLLTK